jgi:probable HAF family extracellular repeat protein
MRACIIRILGFILAVFAALSVVAPQLHADQATLYRITDLGTLGGATSVALGINNFGEVVGYSETADKQNHAFLYLAGGQLLDLGTLGGHVSYASRIRDCGILVGHAAIPDGRMRAFIAAIGTFELFDLSSLDVRLAGPYSTASGINREGQVVGFTYTPGGSNDSHGKGISKRAFLYSNHKITDLGTFDGTDSFATGINNSGQVIGFFIAKPVPGVAYIPTRAFVFSGNKLVDLWTLGRSVTTPTDINDLGQVVGYGQKPGGRAHAFFYSGGRMKDLGTLPGGTQSYAYGINGSGQIVGASESADFTLHAFLYTKGVTQDLNSLIPAHSGWLLSEARDINDAGQIVGVGIVNGQRRGFLLTPLTSPGANVLVRLR